MKIINYAPKTNGRASELQEMINAQLPALQVQACRSIKGLARILGQPLNQVHVIVLWPAGADDLYHLTQMAALFDNSRIIMILPDRSENTISLGVRLNPSFITYTDGRPEDIVSVLKKITTHTKGGTQMTPDRHPRRREGKYLTFNLAAEEYGIRIEKVIEVIGMIPLVKIPRTPDFAVGVINLRGKVIPVMDLRCRFGIAAQHYSERTCIIVVETDRADGKAQVGCVVDAVSEVLNIPGTQIEDTPDFGSRLNTGYILGMAKIEGSVRILLDIDRILLLDQASPTEQTRTTA